MMPGTYGQNKCSANDMIHIPRPQRPNIPIFTRKSINLKPEFKEKIRNLLDPQIPLFRDILDRIDRGGKFTTCEKETLKAIVFFSNPGNFSNNRKVTSVRNTTFKVYKNKKLKEELKKLFKGKCAYCDSTFLGNSPADIEHFRPKNAINEYRNGEDEALIYPGYYWLGAEWSNLLWSCQFCNRKNKLEIPGSVEPKSIGKKNRFPLSDPNRRIRSHNFDINQEKDFVLLIDPCKDHPEQHLEYGLEGETEAVISPKQDNQGNLDPKAKASIPAYALNRTQLIINRKEAGLNLTANFRALIRAFEDFLHQRKNNQDTTFAEEDIKLHKERIRSMMSAEAPFLAYKKVICLEKVMNWQRFRDLDPAMTMQDILPELFN